MHPLSALTVIALTCAALALVLTTVYLLRRPPLNLTTKVWLLFALGVFPVGVALAGNVQGLEASKQREFCASCHVMVPYTDDSSDRSSGSLSSRHGRTKLFGEENCYVCHADYGMFGTVVTKLGGLGHVYRYITEYRNVPLEKSRTSIHLHKPYSNENCMQCHSTETALWSGHPAHHSLVADLRSNQVSCASGSCHGFAHPFSKPAISPTPSATASGSAL